MLHLRMDQPHTLPPWSEDEFMYSRPILRSPAVKLGNSDCLYKGTSFFQECLVVF